VASDTLRRPSFYFTPLHRTTERYITAKAASNPPPTIKIKAVTKANSHHPKLIDRIRSHFRLFVRIQGQWAGLIKLWPIRRFSCRKSLLLTTTTTS
jgi:hypothetical protein